MLEPLIIGQDGDCLLKDFIACLLIEHFHKALFECLIHQLANVDGLHAKLRNVAKTLRNYAEHLRVVRLRKSDIAMQKRRTNFIEGAVVAGQSEEEGDIRVDKLCL